MIFASDNTGPAHPTVMQAVWEANTGYVPSYGVDTITEAARAAVRDVFEAPEAVVEFVSTGTAANALALATLAKPWEGIFCHRTAHFETDECGAPEFYSGGKLVLIDGANGKIDPALLEAEIATCLDRGVDGIQPGPVTITNVTEKGTVYSLEDLRRLVSVAKAHGLPVHLDGARFANACVALGCSAAEMTWKLGIDAVSFGGTKNGCMAVEAVVLFDPEKGKELELRRKRGGHLFSKHRYLSAQMGAYATGGLWHEMATAANARLAQVLAGVQDIPGAEICFEPGANLAFLKLPASAHRRAKAAGAYYYVYPGDGLDTAQEDDLLMCRIVCDWSKSADEVAALLAAWRG